MPISLKQMRAGEFHYKNSPYPHTLVKDWPYSQNTSEWLKNRVAYLHNVPTGMPVDMIVGLENLLTRWKKYEPTNQFLDWDGDSEKKSNLRQLAKKHKVLHTV